MLRNDPVASAMVQMCVALSKDERQARPRWREKLAAYADSLLRGDTNPRADAEIMQYVEDGLNLAFKWRDRAPRPEPVPVAPPPPPPKRSHKSKTEQGKRAERREARQRAGDPPRSSRAGHEVKPPAARDGPPASPAKVVDRHPWPWKTPRAPAPTWPEAAVDVSRAEMEAEAASLPPPQPYEEPVDIRGSNAAQRAERKARIRELGLEGTRFDQ